MVDDKDLAILKLRQEAVLDSLNEGVIIIDSNFRVIDVNKGFMNLFWIKEESVRGISDSKLYRILGSYFDEESKEKFSGVVDLVEKSDKLIGDNYDAKLQKPLEIYISVYTSPIYDDDKGFVGRIWKFKNINEMKLIDNMKTEFISIASHQLRTPLTTINGNIDMILNGDFGDVSESVKSSINDVRAATENLLYLVNGLLDVSRLEMGKIEADMKMKKIRELVNETINLFDTLIKQKELNVIVEVKNDIEFRVDHRLFTEALKNYLSNAFKYTSRKGVVMINVEIRKGSLYLEVVDNGVGVPKSQLDGLFTKFFRADNVRSEDFEGTGLGLYYVKKSIEAMGGTVGFKPGDMNGSTFYFEIPAN